MQIPRATTVLPMAALMLAGTLGESREPTASKRRFTRTLDCLQNFIGLLTTVHFFSVLTRFATYFGVIQSDWHVSPPPPASSGGSWISSSAYEPDSFHVSAAEGKL